MCRFEPDRGHLTPDEVAQVIAWVFAHLHLSMAQLLLQVHLQKTREPRKSLSAV